MPPPKVSCADLLYVWNMLSTAVQSAVSAQRAQRAADMCLSECQQQTASLQSLLAETLLVVCSSGVQGCAALDLSSKRTTVNRWWH